MPWFADSLGIASASGLSYARLGRRASRNQPLFRISRNALQRRRPIRSHFQATPVIQERAFSPDRNISICRAQVTTIGFSSPSLRRPVQPHRAKIVSRQPASPIAAYCGVRPMMRRPICVPQDGLSFVRDLPVNSSLYDLSVPCVLIFPCRYSERCPSLDQGTEDGYAEKDGSGGRGWARRPHNRQNAPPVWAIRCYYLRENFNRWGTMGSRRPH